ncbi:uncharacterized protein LOC128952281 [Oppia nitens]|uniref:uncharacterized protein LOC128952281 n=1 Tax=Oppia nitens TaxID=1686743 RepID=UPI0023DBE57D|nr:uncharacterized protein LOC128952281 [Oppia nitens]
MYFKIVIASLALVSLVHCVPAPLQRDSASFSLTEPLANGQISDAGRHILDKVTVARTYNYKLGLYQNVDLDLVHRNASVIVSAFMDATVGFSSQPCLTVNEEDMWRNENNNCYAVISEKVLRAINGDYDIVVGERAYVNVNFFKSGQKMYEFYLGGLYFGVYQSSF